MEDDGRVRITLPEMYKDLLEVRGDVRAVRQTVEESIKPALAETRTRVTTLEVRVYAIIAGLIAAFGAGKGLGLL